MLTSIHRAALPVVLVAAALGCVAAPAAAQRYYNNPRNGGSSGHFELTAFGGGFVASNIYRRNSDLSYDFAISDAWTYGGRLAYVWRQGFGLEASYARATSDVKVFGVTTPRTKVGELTFNQFDLNALFQSRLQRTVVGYLTVGAGATNLETTVAGADNDTRFAYNLGVGAKISLSRGSPVALRVDARYRGTDLPHNVSSAVACGFYGCYQYASSNYGTGELTGGLTFRF